jgi:hypothetical protein
MGSPEQAQNLYTRPEQASSQPVGVLWITELAARRSLRQGERTHECHRPPC